MYVYVCIYIHRPLDKGVIRCVRFFCSRLTVYQLDNDLIALILDGFMDADIWIGLGESEGIQPARFWTFW